MPDENPLSLYDVLNGLSVAARRSQIMGMPRSTTTDILDACRAVQRVIEAEERTYARHAS